MRVAAPPVWAAAPAGRRTGRAARSGGFSIGALALVLALWSIGSQPFVLLLHNAVPHSHAHAAAAKGQSSHADHEGDRSRPAQPADPADEWCPVLQSFKTLGLYLAPAARIVVAAVPPAAFRVAAVPARCSAARHHDAQPRAPPAV